MEETKTIQFETENEESMNQEQKQQENAKSIIDKRISFAKGTLQKISIIRTLEDDIMQNMQEKEAIGHIVDRAIDFYYKSDEIQKKLLGL